MNPETITLEDCIEAYERKRKAVILKDGGVAGFTYEKEGYQYAKAETN